MNNNKIYILVGFPGIGKSTWVNKFMEENTNFVVVSSDDILQNICEEHGVSYNEGFSKYIDDADRLYKEKLKNMLAEKRNIIVDRTNLSIKSRQKILNMVPEGYTKNVVMFNISEEEHSKRLKERAEKTISNQVLQTMKNSYVEPSFNEKIDAIITIDIN